MDLVVPADEAVSIVTSEISEEIKAEIDSM
jgi:hypothetical protein